MSLKRDYLGIVKLDGGYGGWSCPKFGIYS